ncbi:MAG TPA: TIM barrel protein [Gemmatimonadaceae bacterium]|jgi:sugar phosphate isomerase/epimerase|nr:TIM barrel protein [Gemmatimonadaceae bacterium]
MASMEQQDGRSEADTTLTRRDLFAVAAGTAVALTVGGVAIRDGEAREREERAGSGSAMIPRARRALMAYSARAMLAGDKAKYPTLPVGWREVMDAAAAIGYAGIEFFSFTGAPTFGQAAGADGGASPPPKQIRAWLDAAGLTAVGHYNASVVNGGAVGLTPETIDAALETAAILGQRMTGSHDATNLMRQKREVDAAIERWNAMAVKASRAGIPIYSHTHQVPWSFLLDAGPTDAQGNFTRSSGVRVMDYFLAHTDPKWVKCELDLFWAHVAQHQFSSYTAADGSTVRDVFDPARQVAKDPSRYPMLHAKDGVRAPKTAEGWAICPFGYGDMDLPRFLRESRLDRENPWWTSEQDNADGGDADPQKALRDIASGYRGLAALGQPGGVGAPFAGVPARGG